MIKAIFVGDIYIPYLPAFTGVGGLMVNAPVSQSGGTRFDSQPSPIDHNNYRRLALQHGDGAANSTC